MSLQGIIILDLMGFGLLLLIINLVRTKRLNVGYAVIWCIAVVVPMIIISVPSLLELLPRMFGAIFPASVLSLLAFLFIFLVLIFFSMQLSVIAARQIEIVQALALQELLAKDEAAAGAPPSTDVGPSS